MCRSFQDQNILCNNYTTEKSSVAQENSEVSQKDDQ